MIGLIFISYDGSTGLALGTAIKVALNSQGIDSWLWEEDHPDHYPWADIALHIQKADYICWVCTEGTKESEGQAWEVENAFGQRKWRRSWVVATDRAYVPLVFAGYYQYPIAVETAPEVVAKWVSRRRDNVEEPRVAVVAAEEAAITTSEDVAVSELTESVE